MSKACITEREFAGLVPGDGLHTQYGSQVIIKAHLGEKVRAAFYLNRKKVGISTYYREELLELAYRVRRTPVMMKANV